jgi:hypothetical protein
MISITYSTSSSVSPTKSGSESTRLEKASAPGRFLLREELVAVVPAVVDARVDARLAQALDEPVPLLGEDAEEVVRARPVGLDLREQAEPRNGRELAPVVRDDLGAARVVGVEVLELRERDSRVDVGHGRAQPELAHVFPRVGNRRARG